MASPGCEAWIVHIPAAWIVTVEATTVQTEVASEVKLTVRPDDAVPLTVNGAAPKVLLLSVAKLICWLVRAVALAEATIEPTCSSASAAALHTPRLPQRSTFGECVQLIGASPVQNRSGKFVGRNASDMRECRHATPVAVVSAAVSSYRNSTESDRGLALPCMPASEQKMRVTLSA
jgi:hypothetical protein